VSTALVNDNEIEGDLVRRAAAGEQDALRQLFSMHGDRLKRMVRLRLNRRLQGRLDSSDVLQEAYLEVSQKLGDYARNPEAPFFLWLRAMTGMKLAEVHRRYLGTQMRDADRDVSIYRGALPAADSVSLAAHLLGTLTSPSQAAIKAEMRVRLQEALDAMDPLDREVIALRHFEQLDSAETAHVLGLSKSGASSRYIRAMKRLKEMLKDFEHLME
jgi:RNA polymerase sigma-70 factor (ECF subfamily)